MTKNVKTICMTMVILIVLVNCANTVSAIVSPPTNVTSSLHGNSLTVNWTRSISKNVTQYRIHIYKNGTTQINSMTRYVDANTTSTTFTIPTANVCYNAHVPALVNNSTSSSAISNMVCDHTIKFVTIGDAHIGGNAVISIYIPVNIPMYISAGANNSTNSTNATISINGSVNFTKAINFVNNMTNVDFVVQLGDITNDSSVTNFKIANNTLHKSKKTIYVIEGNHDIGKPSGVNFRKYIGPTDRIINDFKGYQLIFPGIDKSNNPNISAYNWTFNYNTANKSKYTIVFNHGPVKPNPSKSTDCVKSWDSNKTAYYGYACNMSTELANFTNLLGVYAGHVHTNTSKMINNTLYVTEDNLGGMGPTTDYIGYTVAQNGVMTYSRIYYK